jgi:hypothetical protein
MALVTKPYTFTVGATIIAAQHNSNFDTLYNDYNGNITSANLSPTFSLTDSQVGQISTYGKIRGSAITEFNSTNSAAGYIPYANLPTISTSLTGTLPTFNGGTGTSAGANAANGVCILGASAYVPTANLGSGTAGATNYLRGDQTWQTFSSYTASVKIGTFTKSLTNASGDEAYSSVGFQPKYIIFLSGSANYRTFGFSDASTHHCAYRNGDEDASSTSACIYFENGVNGEYTGIVKSMDADGFTITWTKTSTPTNDNPVVVYLAYK